MIGLIGAGLSLIGGLTGNAEAKRQAKEQKKAIALNASETRKGLALQSSQMQQATQGSAIQAQTAVEAADGMAKVGAAEGGLGGNLKTEMGHDVASQAGQAFSGLVMNLNNQLTQNRLAANASQASASSQIGALRGPDMLATLINSVAPWLGQMGSDFGWGSPKTITPVPGGAK